MEWDRTKWDGSRFAFYAELCRLRRSSRALTWGRTEVLFADEDCLAILRATPDSAAIGVVNRSVEARSLSIDLTSLPPGERRAVLAAVERGRVVSSLPESGAGAAAVAVAPVARAAREPSVAAEIGTTIHLEARESGIWVSE